MHDLDHRIMKHNSSPVKNWELVEDSIHIQGCNFEYVVVPIIVDDVGDRIVERGNSTFLEEGE